MWAAVTPSRCSKDEVVTVELVSTELTTREASDVMLYNAYLTNSGPPPSKATARALLLNTLDRIE